MTMFRLVVFVWVLPILLAIVSALALWHRKELKGGETPYLVAAVVMMFILIGILIVPLPV